MTAAPAAIKTGTRVTVRDNHGSTFTGTFAGLGRFSANNWSVIIDRPEADGGWIEIAAFSIQSVTPTR